MTALGRNLPFSKPRPNDHDSGDLRPGNDNESPPSCLRLGCGILAIAGGLCFDTDIEDSRIFRACVYPSNML